MACSRNQHPALNVAAVLRRLVSISDCLLLPLLLSGWTGVTWQQEAVKGRQTSLARVLVYILPMDTRVLDACLQQRYYVSRQRYVHVTS